ncbi:hypothetical protein P153DRAFT_364963 [Dothidotthia symphoricarpi CBS 119687]|uniref:Uncharacterized protein n=1 Tax=Dothidotthia symphoricarpi CBS 119687 TaxID=1392245 RepID=A0A6A6AJH5_9PLEO|nr:uncharacterized protein P153DRAFT_364963 [Dothidotthia symphoricarpi CBS 119687]KAF2131373.1 hypothetical protein P153DRAFT_364963 [Dothidotthia symphoricarpi CBS 119687]
MAMTTTSSTALVPVFKNGAGGGDEGGDGNDKDQQQPGRAHYTTDELLISWELIFNYNAGSAGVKGKHRRCIRCGYECQDHHRKHWRTCKHACVLCENSLREGHIGDVCPIMRQNREFFCEEWVSEAMGSFMGVSKGDFPPPLTEQDVRRIRQSNSRSATRPTQPAPAPAPAPQQALPAFDPAMLAAAANAMYNPMAHMYNPMGPPPMYNYMAPPMYNPMAAPMYNPMAAQMYNPMMMGQMNAAAMMGQMNAGMVAPLAPTALQQQQAGATRARSRPNRGQGNAGRGGRGGGRGGDRRGGRGAGRGGSAGRGRGGLLLQPQFGNEDEDMADANNNPSGTGN